MNSKLFMICPIRKSRQLASAAFHRSGACGIRPQAYHRELAKSIYNDKQLDEIGVEIFQYEGGSS
jgi:hypothetical protein